MKHLYKYIFMLTLSLTFGIVPTFGQGMISVKMAGGYTTQLKMINTKQLKSIAGWEAITQLQFEINDHLAMVLQGGYGDLTIDQNDAVEQWNWPFWERFYGNYIRSLVSQDSNYAVELTPIQHLYIIPVELTIKLAYSITAGLRPFLKFGGGVVFYERHLRLNEKWTKYFPEIDYYFDYQYDNHADAKRGQKYYLNLTLGSDYQFSKHFGLYLDLNYRYFLDMKAENRFPLFSSLCTNLGFIFYY